MGRVRGIIFMLTEVPVSNLFGGGTLRPPSPHRNIAFPDQLKSGKFKVESCYSYIQELFCKSNTP